MNGCTAFPVVNASDSRAEVMEVLVTNRPVMGQTYEAMSKVTANAPVTLHVSAAILSTKEFPLSVGEGSAAQRVDRNAFYSIMEAVDFANIVLGDLFKYGILQPQVVYIQVQWQEEQIGEIVGTSLGVATCLALLGYATAHSLYKIAFTGFVDTTGGPATMVGMEALDAYRIQPILYAKEKLIHCAKSSILLFLPRDNAAELFPTFRNQPYIVDHFKWRVVIKGVMFYSDGIYVYREVDTSGARVLCAIFVSTVGEVCANLQQMGIRSPLIDQLRTDVRLSGPSLRRRPPAPPPSYAESV